MTMYYVLVKYTDESMSCYAVDGKAAALTLAYQRWNSTDNVKWIRTVYGGKTTLLYGSKNGPAVIDHE